MRKLFCLLLVLGVCFFIGSGVAAGAVFGPDGFGYMADTEAAFSWEDTGGAIDTLVDGDDVNAGPFPIGFTFTFYGQDYTQFYVCSNGWV